MGASQQRKGAAGERELAALLRQYGYDIQRGGFVFGEIPDLIGLPGIHIEVKRVEKLNLDAALDQAIRDSEKFKDGFPAVFHRKNHRKWEVTMLLDDWLEIYNNSDYPDSK
jgi:Holliday junction resolvase